MPPREIHVDISNNLHTEDECTICLSSISQTSRVLMQECAHVFHEDCIHNWHRTQRRNNRPLSCPLCRTEGPVARHTWPCYRMNGGCFGPWGTVTLFPDHIQIIARYWFSHPTKQSISYGKIGGYFKNGNCVMLADQVGDMLITFHIRKSREFFKTLGTMSTDYFQRHRARLIRPPGFINS